MIIARQPVPMFENESILAVFHRCDTNVPIGGMAEYSINIDEAKFVSSIRDIKADPLAVEKDTMLKLYKLYPRLKELSKVLWNGKQPNWNLEKPLACIGVSMYRDSPRARTLKLHLGKMTLEFKC